MAELKVHEIPYDIEEEAIQPVASEHSHTPERPEVVVVPLSPSRKLNRISKMEKWLTLVLIAALIGLGLVMINLRTTISKVEQDISIIQDGVTKNEAEILQLEQEKSELSKSERIREIAEEKGLTITSDNLRKVKK
ncbi:cell division protein FtsL [Enterococcus olivae]